MQIKSAFSNFANPSMTRKKHTTRIVYFRVQFHPGLPDIKGILPKNMPLLHQSVTMKVVVPDLTVITFSQSSNLGHSLCMYVYVYDFQFNLKSVLCIECRSVCLF